MEKGRKGNGEGTWKQLPSGKWIWQRWYTTKNGTKTRISVTGETKTECRQVMKRKEEESETKSRMDSSTGGILATLEERYLPSSSL